MKFSTITLALILGTAPVASASKHVRIHPKSALNTDEQLERRLTTSKAGKSITSRTGKSNKASKGGKSSKCSYTDAAKSFNGNIATVDVSHQYIFMLII